MMNLYNFTHTLIALETNNRIFTNENIAAFSLALGIIAIVLVLMIGSRMRKNIEELAENGVTVKQQTAPVAETASASAPAPAAQTVASPRKDQDDGVIAAISAAVYMMLAEEHGVAVADNMPVDPAIGFRIKSITRRG